jgi:hypothetical protein
MAHSTPRALLLIFQKIISLFTSKTLIFALRAFLFAFVSSSDGTAGRFVLTAPLPSAAQP